MWQRDDFINQSTVSKAKLNELTITLRIHRNCIRVRVAAPHGMIIIEARGGRSIEDYQIRQNSLPDTRSFLLYGDFTQLLVHIAVDAPQGLYGLVTAREFWFLWRFSQFHVCSFVYRYLGYEICDIPLDCLDSICMIWYTQCLISVCRGRLGICWTKC